VAKVYDAQGEADKAARRLCREAYERGGTVPYTLGRLIELKLSMKVIRAVYRNPLAEQVAKAREEVAGWSPERRTACQLEGGGR
jgi:hypothetical protein